MPQVPTGLARTSLKLFVLQAKIIRHSMKLTLKKGTKKNSLSETQSTKLREQINDLTKSIQTMEAGLRGEVDPHAEAPSA